MKFNTAAAVEAVSWQLRLADYSRDVNRSRINDLANGGPPYSEDDALKGSIEVNVNDLSLTRLAHDARSQLYSAFNKPGRFYTATTDAGAVAKRTQRTATVTKEANRIMKRSLPYYECQRSSMALDVLHGIGPSNWEGSDRWRPIPLGVEDVLLPARTLLTMENLPFFAIYRPYTAHQLQRFIRNPKRASEAGWNVPAVREAIRWADAATEKLHGGPTFHEYWSPSKMNERMKEDSGIYASDLVQNIDCIDFYFWDDSNRHEGWRRRIIFDAWGGYSAWRTYGKAKSMPEKNLIGKSGKDSQFVFSSGDRVVADKLDQIIHWQFADLSAVAPFRYHSVRSLGWLLYAACHLQNRLRCAFAEAVFENMMMYMRVNSEDELAEVLNVTLANRKFIDKKVQFIPPGERWQPNYQFAQLGLNEFKQIISDNSSSYVQNQNFSRDRVEKTKFQVMAEVNAMQQMVSSALAQAYKYQEFQFQEIFRRLVKRNSTDPDVNEFQARCMARDVPEKYLVPDAWNIESERVLGGGNRTMEMAIAQQLWEMRAAFTPEAQQQIQRDVVLAITEDPARAESLVPSTPSVSRDRHDGMVSFGSIMAGAKVELTKAQNRIEIVQIWLAELNAQVQQATQMGNMASRDKIAGMANVLDHCARLIAEIGQDDAQKELAKAMAQISGNLANQIKGFAQRLAQQEQAQGQNGNGEMAKLQAQMQAELIKAQSKAKITEESHAQRTAQRQVSFEMKQDQDATAHEQRMIQEAESAAIQSRVKLIEAKTDSILAQIQAASKPTETTSE